MLRQREAQPAVAFHPLPGGGRQPAVTPRGHQEQGEMVAAGLRLLPACGKFRAHDMALLAIIGPCPQDVVMAKPSIAVRQPTDVK